MAALIIVLLLAYVYIVLWAANNWKSSKSELHSRNRYDLTSKVKPPRKRNSKGQYVK